MPKKLTQQEFIDKANKKHNYFYDYSQSIYLNSFTKIKIICPKHGLFEQQPNNHLFGQGCIKCMSDNVRKARKLSHNEFVEKLEKIQPEIFTYNKIKSEYINNKTKITLECKYGDVEILPSQLLQGTKPCISNAIDPLKYLSNFIKINNPHLYKKIINISGKYKGVMNKISINTIYGIVKVTPDSLLRGGGFDIRSSINKHEYLYKYLEIHQPQYNKYNITFTSEFQGVNNTIYLVINNTKFITTPTALMYGYFSPTSSPGIYNDKNIIKNKLENLNKKCILYKIKLYNNEECFYKIGITTTTISNRFNQIPYNVEIIELITTNLYDGYYQEKQLHEQLSEFKYFPKINFGGKHECFTKI
jgi:hypothetical protein